MIAFMISSCSTSSKTYSHYTSKKKTRSNKVEKELSREYDIRNEIIVTALQYVGRSYRYGGKTPQSGFDCSGFISYVYTEAGIPLSGASHDQAQLGILKSYENLQPGDLVFFGNKDKVSHVSLVLKNEKDQLEVIHCTTSMGVKIDKISNSSYWKGKFLFARDILHSIEWVSK